MRECKFSPLRFNLVDLGLPRVGVITRCRWAKHGRFLASGSDEQMILIHERKLGSGTTEFGREEPPDLENWKSANHMSLMILRFQLPPSLNLQNFQILASACKSLGFPLISLHKRVSGSLIVQFLSSFMPARLSIFQIWQWHHQSPATPSAPPPATSSSPIPPSTTPSPATSKNSTISTLTATSPRFRHRPLQMFPTSPLVSTPLLTEFNHQPLVSIN
ncbi:hypothetical protein PS2_030829 [Malus domestica]